MQEPNYVEVIGGELGLKEYQVSVVLELVAEGATVPFIARYRKERTGNLDEEVIRTIIELKHKYETLYKAKVTAINGIEEMGKMTPELMENIINAKTLKEVEEIYKPYKSKKKTKAMIAIEKGFQIVADSIKKNGNIEISEELLAQYSREEILEGSEHIISAEVSASAPLRDVCREYVSKKATIASSIKSETSLEKLNAKDKEQIKKFDIYADFSLNVAKIKPYQILALNRGENLWILNVKIEKDELCEEEVKSEYGRILWVKKNFIDHLQNAFADGYTALFKSVENEARGMLTELAEDDAIKSFQSNLYSLLMTKPEYGKKILAIDPWYRAGCKLCILDALGTPLLFDKIFLHEPESAKKKLKSLFEKEHIEVIIVGNGTGSDEIIALVKEVSEIDIFVVNESGASVYSASEVAQEEFPDLDSLDRGTVSIGRRYIDPLSELVKVPVGSIGVGMYQHDMAVKKLEEKLGFVVEDVVNKVGINVNTASSYVLNHISWIDKRTALKIYNHRPYTARAGLKKILSDKVFEQAVWFLRVPESKEALDNTDIHPDQYALAKYVVDHMEASTNIKQFFESQKTTLLSLYPDVNVDTLTFIMDAYHNIWKDPRVHSSHKKANAKVDLKVLKEGDMLEGIVRNVVAFWAFVDVGLKNDGLVHISELADVFVKNPLDFVTVWQKVRVKVTNIDQVSGKIKLSMRGV